MACSTDETCSTRRRTGVVGAVPAGTRSGDVRGGPDRLARDDDEPGVERGVVDRRSRRGPRGPRTTRSRRSSNDDPRAVGPELEAGPAEDERAMGVVLELVLGVDPAADPDVARRGRLARATRLGDRDAPASPRAGARPDSAGRTSAARRRRRRSATRPATRGIRGDTAAMIPAGHERARRNLHDTWALRRSQPLVSLGPSGLGRMVRGRGAAGQSDSSTESPDRLGRLSTARPQSGR